eukprot:TRINITY_DN21875_c0_g1_i1.p1 TRINITY_DN21875_c0_g1~~TRINITY_DN21875_c0_g1_i1.p1  ORF type:complete len:222 (-),score=26.59 TRINITY_DN21875_c0_g1_i1:303-968(-)
MLASINCGVSATGMQSFNVYRTTSTLRLPYPSLSLSKKHRSGWNAQRRCRTQNEIKCIFNGGKSIGKGIDDAKNSIKKAFESAFGGLRNIFSKQRSLPDFIQNVGDGGSWESGSFGGRGGGRSKDISFDDDDGMDGYDAFHTTMTIIVLVFMYCLIFVRRPISDFVGDCLFEFDIWVSGKIWNLESKISSYTREETVYEYLEDFAISIEDDSKIFEDGDED